MKNKKSKSKNFIKTIAWLGVIAAPIASSFIIVEYALKNGTPTPEPKPEPVTGYVADSFTFGKWEGNLYRNTVEASFVINNLCDSNGESYELTEYSFGIYMSHTDGVYGTEYAGIITAGVWNMDAGDYYETKSPTITSSGTEKTVTWLPGSALYEAGNRGIVSAIRDKYRIYSFGDIAKEITFKLCVFQDNPTSTKTWDDKYFFVKDKNGNELSFVESIILPCH